MVHSVMPASPTRDRLLAAAVSHALTAGIADLSLRELASAIGTSHRMLIYHFGSREGLLVAVTQAVEEKERAALLGLHSALTPDDARRAWQRLSDPGMWPQERLFFELYSYALLGRPGTEGFLSSVIEPWIGPIADALVQSGADKKAARAQARLGMAVVRGLLLDLLATEDRDGADAAFELFLQIGTAAAGALPPGPPSVP
jgi:AcrR family transcriptional regulator